MNKAIKTIISILLVGLMAFVSLSCSSGSDDTATTTTRTATVQKGDITISIVGTGNLAYSHSEQLAFEMAGYVEEVMVSAGDTVTEGQELAKLDTSEWDTQIKNLERSLENANRSVETANRSLTSKQSALVKANGR